MAFKNPDPKLTCAEIALTSSMNKNPILDTLMNMNSLIDWSIIKTLLLKRYKIRKSGETADACPYLMLFKALLLQKWFRVTSETRAFLKNPFKVIA